MEIKVKLNGKFVSGNIAPDMLLIDFLRDHGCYSVKRGCETSNCGLCTVLMDQTPVLSCSVLAARAMDTRCRPLRAFRMRRQNLPDSLLIRVLINVVSATRVL